jgi:hypothetical protein
MQMNFDFIFTRGCKIRQFVTLLFSGFLFICFLYFFVFVFSFYTALLFFLGTSIFIFINLLLSKIYEIKIEGKRMLIQNVWKSFQYPLTDLLDVLPVHFIVPYPFNPYLKFVLSNGNTYIATIPNPLKYYLQSGGIERYLRELKENMIIERA